MKKLLLIGCLAALAACGKDDAGEPSDNTGSNTVVKSCRVQKTVLYNGDGSVETESYNYYSGGLLDSVVNVGKSNTTRFIYKYTSKTERRSDYFINDKDTDGYSLQTLNEYGEVIESRNFNQDGSLSSRSTTNYICD